MVTEFLVALIVVTVFNKCTAGVSMKRFVSLPTCSTNWVLGSDVIDASLTRSSLDCTTSCGKRDDCLAVNICDKDPNLVVCELLGARAGECTNLLVTDDCRYREKEPQDYSPCQNGGTWTHDPPCHCWPGWAGVYCERLVRDCHEGEKSGQRGWTMSLIQPVGCPYSFMAFCPFNLKTTYILRRGQYELTDCVGNILVQNKDFNDYKKAYGDGALQNTALTCDLFLGLNNIWHLLRQGSYHLHVFLQYFEVNGVLHNTDIYYWNFKMAPEADGYAIQYSSFTADPGVGDGLMLDANTPTRFCTRDRDCGTCVRDRGVAWWYTPNCDNYPLTASNADLKWPINGVQQLLDQVVMQVWPGYYYW